LLGCAAACEPYGRPEAPSANKGNSSRASRAFIGFLYADRLNGQHCNSVSTGSRVVKFAGQAKRRRNDASLRP